MKQYGDEDFIFLIQEEAQEKELQEDHVNRIQDGYLVLHEEKILFQRRTLLEDKITMIAPVLFEPMPEYMAELKYPNTNRPDYILTNPQTTINLTFSLQNDRLAAEETQEARDAIQKLVLKLHPESKVIDSKTVEAGEISIAYFDFVTPALDSDIYNFMFLFSWKGRMLMGSFNCLQPDMHDWKEIFLQMLSSIEAL